MSTALQLHDNDMSSWAVIRQQAEVLVKTGFLPQSIETPEQAMAIILTGRELGIGTMAALNTINVIQGKPTVSPQLMLALINRSGQVENIQIDSGKDGATVTIKRKGRSAYTARFGPAEAAAMQLNSKDNYKKQPATMYKWRAVADAARATFADVLLGLYTPDEMGATTDLETGEVVGIIEAPERDFVQPDQRGPGLPIYDEPPFVEAEPEPEPARPVKPEGAQPQADTTGKLPTLKGNAGQITALGNALGWTEAVLVEEIRVRFGSTVMPGQLESALEFMQPTEARTLIQAMKGELQARNGGK